MSTLAAFSAAPLPLWGTLNSHAAWGVTYLACIATFALSFLLMQVLAAASDRLAASRDSWTFWERVGPIHQPAIRRT